MKNRNIIYLLLFTGLLSVLIAACKKTIVDPNPENPFPPAEDNNIQTTDTVNPASIVGLHKNIFSPKCANPGCHDGHFEPDFRTIESSYHSLTWARVIKNTTDSAFRFRVVPYDHASSWLHERVTTGDNVIGKMPLYAPALSSQEIENIKTWINNGAKDMFGLSPKYPNSEPQVMGYIVTNTNYTGRYDTVRVGGVYYNSFKLPANSNVLVLVVANDDSTAMGDLINNKIRISTNEDDFSAPVKSINGTFLSFGSNQAWQFALNTSGLVPGTIYYMRYSCNDGDHPADTYIPTENLIYQYKTYWSFVIE